MSLYVVDNLKGDLMLSFMGRVAELLRDQFDPAQWQAASDSCLALLGQLEQIDYAGFYYCRDDIENGCEWDANADVRDRPNAVLPQIKLVCEAVRDMVVAPGTPSQCSLTLDAVSGFARTRGVASCLEYFARNDVRLKELGCERDDALDFCGFMS